MVAKLIGEAFFRESFKENLKRDPDFSLPRQSYKRGVKGSQPDLGVKRKKGISNDQVCVVCALDRTGNIITELTCKGRIRHTDLERLFSSRIEDDSIFCSDTHRSHV